MLIVSQSLIETLRHWYEALRHAVVTQTEKSISSCYHDAGCRSSQAIIRKEVFSKQASWYNRHGSQSNGNANRDTYENCVKKTARSCMLKREHAQVTTSPTANT